MYFVFSCQKSHLLTGSWAGCAKRKRAWSKHGVFCQLIVEKNGEQIVHNVGGGELRIDVPLPPKVAAATPAPAAAKPAAPAAAKPVEKRLSRLEQLRQEQEATDKLRDERAQIDAKRQARIQSKSIKAMQKQRGR